MCSYLADTIPHYLQIGVTTADLVTVNVLVFVVNATDTVYFVLILVTAGNVVVRIFTVFPEYTVVVNGVGETVVVTSVFSKTVLVDVIVRVEVTIYRVSQYPQSMTAKTIDLPSGSVRR